MDILSHGLWAVAGGKALKGSSPLRSRNISLGWAFFWGVFPDLFAFTVPFVTLIGSIIIGATELQDWPRPERGEPPAANHWPGLSIASMLYPYSHSIVVFGIVAIVLWSYCRLRTRQFPLELVGWPLHILIDIPTHSYRFFPTPVFWPISEWKFDGFSWTHPVFLIVNYSLLVLVFLLLRRKNSF